MITLQYLCICLNSPIHIIHLILQITDLHDFALFDLRVDSNGTPWLLEVGLFCSFSKNSVLNKMALKVGISPNQLLAKLARNAIIRHSHENEVH